MSYVKQTWEDLPSQNTPITAARLNHMEDGIAEAWEHGGSGVGETLKIGTILPYSGSSSNLPVGYMLCDGTAISRTTYSELFNIIGTSFGTGDGSTTFNLPNLKGKVLTGLNENDADFASMGMTGGSKFIQDHTHTSMYSVETTGAKGSSYASMPFVRAGGSTADSAIMKTASVASLTTGNAGNLQPYVVVNYIIKVMETTPTAAQIVGTYTENDSDGYSTNYINTLQAYSLTETRVGTWIDDKPIYRKVISLGLLPNNTTKRVASGISNLEFVTSLCGIALAGTYFITLPDSYPVNVNYNVRLSYDLSTNEIVITAGADRSTYSGYAIIEYTKTTD